MLNNNNISYIRRWMKWNESDDNKSIENKPSILACTEVLAIKFFFLLFPTPSFSWWKKVKSYQLEDSKSLLVSSPLCFVPPRQLTMKFDLIKISHFIELQWWQKEKKHSACGIFSIIFILCRLKFKYQTMLFLLISICCVIF